jgi:ubiquinone/menaquinone biosynthesis C-methylase UbiE
MFSRVPGVRGYGGAMYRAAIDGSRSQGQGHRHRRHEHPPFSDGHAKSNVNAAPIAPAVSLTCPDCKVVMERAEDKFHCPRCEADYAIDEGIPRFCKEDIFYDDYLDEHCPHVLDPPPWKRNLLRVVPYWSWREWRFFDAHVRPGMRILDLGCARGKQWFSAKAAFIAGVDPTFAPLVECARHYDLVAQAEITRLPFESESFDCVVTSHVLGHIAHDQKDAAISEIARVLRPGGVSANIIETDSNHRFVALGKSDPQLYTSNFIETDGHVGLELPTAVLARFRSHGLEPMHVQKMESGLIHLRYYGKFLGEGYPERASAVRRRIRAWQALQKNSVSLGIYEVVMGSYHRFVEPWRTPLDHAMFLAAAFVKETGS